MKRTITKVLSFTTCLCVLISSVGCSKKTEIKKQMGRYVENQYTLKKEDRDIISGNYQLISYDGSNGKPQFLTNSADGFKLGSLDKENTISFQPASDYDWIKSSQPDADTFELVKSKDGSDYVLTTTWDESITGCSSISLIKKENNTFTSIPISDFQMLDKSTPLEVPSQCIVLEDSRILCVYDTHMELYHPDGSSQYSFENVIGSVCGLQGKQLLTLSSVSNHIEFYDLESGQLNHTVPTDSLFDINTLPYASLSSTTDKNGNFYLLCPKGIFRLGKGKSTWFMIVDGVDNAMSSSQYWQQKLYVSDTGNFYSICQDSANFDMVIFEYYFDKTITSVPEEELKIYSLFDSQSIHAAMSFYKKQNPNVSVNYYVALPDGGDETAVTDCIKTLNTQLLSDNGPDLIVLDGLDINSMIEKKLLMNLNELVTELPDLFPFAADTYKREDVVYALPSRIEIPIMLGSSDAISAVSSLQSLADYASGLSSPLIFGARRETLMNTLYSIYKSEIFNKEGKLDETVLTPFFENMKQVFEKSSDNDKNFHECVGYGISDSLYTTKNMESQLGFGLYNDNRSIKWILSVSQDSGNMVSSVNHIYYPHCILSVNTTTKNKKESLDFINSMMSESCQKHDSCEGTPVIRTCVPTDDVTYQPKGSNSIATYPYQDTSFRLHYHEIQYPDKEQISQYTSVYDTLSKASDINYIIDAKIRNGLKSYLFDEEPLDQTIASLKQFVELYNQE